MKQTLIRQLSPNCDHREIPVEYLVLHYTAVDLQETLDIFMSPAHGVSAHLVIDRDGTVYELVECLEGKAFRAWHAGVSSWAGREAFNDHAIGIELVNYNGNLFDFTEAQYTALAEVTEQLQVHYPALNDPDRVVGHEQIAGFRGKADPGRCFDWQRYFSDCFPESPAPKREFACPEELQNSLMKFLPLEPEDDESRSAFWKVISELTETSVRLVHQGASPRS